MSTLAVTSWLIPLAGPPLDVLAIKQPSVTLGRQQDNEIPLPENAEQISRKHARITHTPEGWRIRDLKSRWGTFLNGVKLTPMQQYPLVEGDLLRITPWTFSFSLSGQTAGKLTFDAADDTQAMQTMVRAVRPEEAPPLATDMLTLLLESAAGIHAATDEKMLAELLLDVARRGTGLPNAAVLHPLDAAGRVEVIASKRTTADDSSPLFSRSLLLAASKGVVAELTANSAQDNISQSIVQMKINAALCVPLMLGSTVAAYLYLDSRGGYGGGLRPNASAFCLGMGRMAGLALANLKRIDIERRQASIESDLRAGAEAQKWIFPKRSVAGGKFTAIGESRAGQYVGGDFFDVIPLGESKIAIALGDVTGKGVAASVLMTATQGFLHATLERSTDLSAAIAALNAFVAPRCPDTKFVTLWVGVFDLETRMLTFVNAGHGYAMMITDDGAVHRLDGEAGLPVGVMADAEFQTQSVPLPASGRALVISDGFVEQPAAGTAERQQFEMSGIESALHKFKATPERDEIAHLFDLLEKHAGSTQLADDATAVMVKW